MSSQQKHSTGVPASFLALAFVVGAISNYLYGSFILVGTADRIDVGVTRMEVFEIAGPPHKIGREGTWLYRVLNYGDMLSVEFDENGVVESANF